MKKVWISLAILLTTTVITGCASLFGERSWLSIETNPENATVRVYGINTGETLTQTTPARIELNKSSDYKITIESPNYRSEEIIIRRSINGWFWGNILLGGLIGMAIDGFSNNMWMHNQHLIQMDLASLTTSMPDTVELNIPVVLYKENNTRETVYCPVTFHRKS